MIEYGILCSKTTMPKTSWRCWIKKLQQYFHAAADHPSWLHCLLLRTWPKGSESLKDAIYSISPVFDDRWLIRTIIVPDMVTETAIKSFDSGMQSFFYVTRVHFLWHFLCVLWFTIDHRDLYKEGGTYRRVVRRTVVRVSFWEYTARETMLASHTIALIKS